MDWDEIFTEEGGERRRKRGWGEEGGRLILFFLKKKEKGCSKEFDWGVTVVRRGEGGGDSWKRKEKKRKGFMN